ncbi:MAG: hypothetical protein FJ104_17860 [Deltaproteobacteria bacterium]|nr:hypothetical protein [Deltaproteobacteria bacterium]
MTGRDDLYGASVSETASVIQGAFRADGTHVPLTPGMRQWALEFAPLVGVRPLPRLELNAATALALAASTAPGTSSRRFGLGDSTVRIRVDAIDEPLPFERHALPWPSLALVGSTRLPTAARAGLAGSGAFGGTTGSAVSGSSLGTTELALAAVLVRTFDAFWQLSGSVEGGLRLPDEALLGAERRLGPRLTSQATLRRALDPWWSVGLGAELGLEGDVTFDGATRPDTSQRVVATSAFIAARLRETGLRWGALARVVPPVDGLSRNATSSTAISVSLGYAN